MASARFEVGAHLVDRGTAQFGFGRWVDQAFGLEPVEDLVDLLACAAVADSQREVGHLPVGDGVALLVFGEEAEDAVEVREPTVFVAVGEPSAAFADRVELARVADGHDVGVAFAACLHERGGVSGGDHAGLVDDEEPVFGDGQAAHEHGLFGGFGAQAAAFPGVGEPGVLEALRDAFPARVLAAGAQLVEEFVDGVGVDAEALLQFARGPGGFAGADDLAFPVHLVDDVDHGAHGGGLAAARGADHAADEVASGEHGGARVFLVAAEWMVRSGRIIGEQVAHAPSCLPVRGFVEPFLFPHGFDVFLVLGEFGRVPALLGRTVGSGDAVEDADARVGGHARVDPVTDRVDGDARVEHPLGERAHEPVARAGGVEADAGGEPFGRGHDACGGECGVVAGHFPTDLFDHVPFGRLWGFGQVVRFGVLPHLLP